MIKRGSGLFIAFEGLDGSGSSVQASLLAGILQKEGYRVHLTKEPSNSLTGGLLRAGLTGEWYADAETRQLLFAADRAQHLTREIKPNLEAGKIVIIDRYRLSSIAYGNLRIDDTKWLEEINRLFIDPDLTFFIDVEPKICALRIKKSHYGLEMYKEEKDLKKILANYKRLAKQNKGIYIVDGQRDEMEVIEEIRKITQKALGLQNKPSTLTTGR